MEWNLTPEQAVEQFREQMARVDQLRGKVDEARTKVRSTDGMITVVVDGRGELSSITFNTAKWRQMAPAELSAAIVQTIKKASAKNREELMSALGPLLPKGLDFDRPRNGSARIDQMLEDAARRAGWQLYGEDSGLADPQSDNSQGG